MLIKESYVLTAANADILAAPSRLAAIPRNGVLTIEASTTDSDATNFGRLTLTLPEGDIPFQDLIIPANGLSTADSVMDTDTQLVFTLEVMQGGHVILAYAEDGTVPLTLIYITLSF